MELWLHLILPLQGVAFINFDGTFPFSVTTLKNLQPVFHPFLNAASISPVYRLKDFTMPCVQQEDVVSKELNNNFNLQG